MKETTIVSATPRSLVLALVAGCSSLYSRPDTHTPLEPDRVGQTFTTAELRGDLRFVRQVIEEVHPRPHERLSSEELDARVEELAARTDLSTRVLRLRVAMKLSSSELARAESLLQDLGGSDSRPARVGVLTLDKRGLELETNRIEDDCLDLPDVLKAVARRLQREAEKPDQRRVAQRALHQLIRTAKGGA